MRPERVCLPARWPSLRRMLLVAVPLVALSGCTSLSRATRDETRLRGEVPVGLGRSLVVHVDGADPETEADLLGAVERELTRRDLFDRVDEAADEGLPPGARASQLWITVVSTRAEELSDLALLKDAFVARYDLEIELRDTASQPVLEGHVSGIGADPLTALDFITAPKRKDIRLAALHDAAMKMSWALRRAAGARAKKALETLPVVRLPSGLGPLPIAVLGFDDPPQARRRRGRETARLATEAMGRLGPELLVIDPDEVQRAVSRLPDGLYDLHLRDPYELKRILARVPVAFLVVGAVRSDGGGRSTVALRALNPRGELVFEHEAGAEGLGALPVATVKVTRELARFLETRGAELEDRSPPPEPQ